MSNGIFAKFEYSVVFRCSRNGNSRSKSNPSKVRKIGSKKLGFGSDDGCQCQIMFKKYEGQEILELVSYQRSHSHPLDVSAIKYPHISPEIKEFIKNCFEKGISFAAVREALPKKNWMLTTQ